MAFGEDFEVRSIVRSAAACTRETRQEQHVRRHNPTNAALHPLQHAREYVRALNAVKLERLFARPLAGVLEGHRDGIYTLAVDSTSMRRLITGSADGDLRVWDLARRRCTHVLPDAHRALIRSVALPCAELFAGEEVVRFYSASDDHTVKLWQVPVGEEAANLDGQQKNSLVASYDTGGVVLAVDCHRREDVWLTAGAAGVLEWSSQRSQPLRAYALRPDAVCSASYASVRVNAASGNMFVASSSDRAIVVGDRRMGTIVSRQVLAAKANALCWNWQAAPTVFAAGCEDSRAYAFDLRRLSAPQQVYINHVGPVLSVDYDGTGTVLATGSYDRTLRLYDTTRPDMTLHSRDVYHARRMQRLWAVRFAADAAYVLSGSDDGCVRLWKTHASMPTGPLTSRHAVTLDYRRHLVDKFAQLPEVKRIARHRHLPKTIKEQQRQQTVQRNAQLTRAQNRIKHGGSSESLPNPRNDIVLRVDDDTDRRRRAKGNEKTK